MGEPVRLIEKAEFVADWLPIRKSILTIYYTILNPGQKPHLRFDWPMVPIPGDISDSEELSPCLVRETMGFPTGLAYNFILEKIGRDAVFICDHVFSETAFDENWAMIEETLGPCCLWRGGIDNLGDHFRSVDDLCLFDQKADWVIMSDGYQGYGVFAAEQTLFDRVIEAFGGMDVYQKWYLHYEFCHAPWVGDELGSLFEFYKELGWSDPEHRTKTGYAGDPSCCDTPELIEAELKRLKFKPAG